MMNNRKQQFWDFVEGLLFLVCYFCLIEYTNLEERPWLLITIFVISMLVLIIRTHNRYVRNIKVYQEHKILEITEKCNSLIHGFGFPFFVVVTLLFLVGFWGGASELIIAFPVVFSIGALLFKMMYRNKIFVNEKQISYSELGVLFTEVNIKEVIRLELEDNNLLKIYKGKRVQKKSKEEIF